MLLSILIGRFLWAYVGARGRAFFGIGGRLDACHPPCSASHTGGTMTVVSIVRRKTCPRLCLSQGHGVGDPRGWESHSNEDDMQPKL